MRESSTEESAAVCQEAGRLPFTGHVIQYFPLFDNDAALNSKNKDTLGVCACVSVCVSVCLFILFLCEHHFEFDRSLERVSNFYPYPSTLSAPLSLRTLQSG